MSAADATADPQRILRSNEFWRQEDPEYLLLEFDKCQREKERMRQSIYANAKDFRLCYWTGMGVWIALRGNKVKGNNKLPLDKGGKERNCGSKYCEQVSALSGVSEISFQSNSINDQ